MKIRLDPLDRLFSRYIRLRDGGICQRCGKYVGLTQGLHCAHFHGRANRNTRYDDQNSVSLCFGCHRHFHAHPLEFVEFFKARLGEQAFDMLRARANEVGRPDKKAIELWLKKELKKLNNIRNLNKC